MVQFKILVPVHSLVHALAIIILFFGVPAGSAALAQDRVLAPSDPTELIGATVFTANGSEVVAVSVGAGGEIREMRMTTESPLGIGPRTVVLPLESITVLRGAVVLDLSPSEVDMLPNAPDGSPRNPTKL
jgi:hypothetical protein